MTYRILGLAVLALPMLAGGSLAWAQETGAGPGPGPGAAPGSSASRPWYDLRLMPDPILDQVLLFYLSEARHGMTDIGEVLDTAGRVRADDEYSWTREWAATAARVQKMAEAGEKAGHPIGAGEAWLRASALLPGFPRTGTRTRRLPRSGSSRKKRSTPIGTPSPCCASLPRR